MSRSEHRFKIAGRLTLLVAVSIIGLSGIATAWASGTTRVSTSKKKSARILVQQKGYTLYVYCSFGAQGNVCTKGHTSGMWSPMIAYHRPVAGSGIKQSKLGTKKVHGHKVVTYYGQPLYRYKGDRKPGQTKGEGKQNKWWIVSQYGQPITSSQY